MLFHEEVRQPHCDLRTQETLKNNTIKWMN
jgi:hypothetical protein